MTKTRCWLVPLNTLAFKGLKQFSGTAGDVFSTNWGAGENRDTAMRRPPEVCFVHMDWWGPREKRSVQIVILPDSGPSVCVSHVSRCLAEAGPTSADVGPASAGRLDTGRPPPIPDSPLRQVAGLPGYTAGEIGCSDHCDLLSGGTAYLFGYGILIGLKY